MSNTSSVVTFDLAQMLNYNGYRIYVDIMTGKKLLTWTTLIGQFVNPERGEGMD